MPWIMLTEKLPTKPSPPMLSIHYATPWPWVEQATRQEQMERQRMLADYSAEETEPDLTPTYFAGEVWGLEHNATLGMRIHYQGEDIRVWAAEYSILPPERMRDYLFGMSGEDIPSHELIANHEADAYLLRQALESDLTSIYDAALLDGCTPEMAQAVAMGFPIDDLEFEFPNIGWYRCKTEYALMFCNEREMKE